MTPKARDTSGTIEISPDPPDPSGLPDPPTRSGAEPNSLQAKVRKTTM